MQKGSGGNAPSLPVHFAIFIVKPAVFSGKHAGFFHFAGFTAGFLTPGLLISRILTREGAAVPVVKPVEI